MAVETAVLLLLWILLLVLVERGGRKRRNVTNLVDDTATGATTIQHPHHLQLVIGNRRVVVGI
jgi:hypothetical protein